jgi:naphthalene 1,2-dioxygenase system ferredoxin subunit
MPWTVVAPRNVLDGRDVVGVDCGGRRLALYALGDEVCATADACPHLGGALSEGCLIDGYIECPQHYALFDVRTGASDGAVTAQSVRTFAVKLADDGIYVDLPEAEASPP